MANKVSTKLTTVHNWVELVYKAFGPTLPTGVKELALLGVREASIEGRKSNSDAFKDYNEGDAAKADYSKGSRKNPKDPDKPLTQKSSNWNDLLFAVWTDSEKEDSQGVDVYQCAIDPQGADSKAGGTPYLLEGKLYKGYPSYHGPVKGEVALHLYTSSTSHIVVARHATGYNVFKQLADANTVTKSNNETFRRGEFVREETANDSIHVHFATHHGNSSIGCTILTHAVTSERYKHFIDTFKAATNKKKIPYLVVSSQYVRLYDDWVKQVDSSSGTPGPETVILKDQLRSPKGMAGRYLPSIMTTDFANAVIDQGQAVMLTSLEKALFTVPG